MFAVTFRLIVDIYIEVLCPVDDDSYSSVSPFTYLLSQMLSDA